MALDYMLKHRGFPGRLPGTDFQFTLRRANPKGATPAARTDVRRTNVRMRHSSKRFGSISEMRPSNGAI